MDGFAVYPSVIISASAGFLDLQNWASDIHRGLIGSCDTLGGMAGDDQAGNIFASQYDKAADAVVNGFGRVVAQLGGTCNGLFETAATYVKADADSASLLGKGYELPAQNNPDCDQQSKIISLPSARGYASWPTREILARFWPQGDPDKLTQAAEDWQRAAKLISDLADYGQDQTIRVTACCQSSAIDAFQNNWVRTQQAITIISDTATQVSSACSIYATKIRQLRAHLEHLAEAAGAIAAGGIALTLLTVGISDAAAAGGEAVIVTEAAAAAAAMEAELAASAEVAVLAEAAQVVDQTAAAMIPVASTAAAFSGGSGAATATLASYTMPPPGPGTARYPFTGAVGPIPPPQPQLYPDLSPAGQAQFRAWMTRMQADGRTKPTSMPYVGKPRTIGSVSYQLRIAGDREYELYTTLPQADNKTNRDIPRDQRGEATMWADGVRPQDGAAIEAKYVNKPNSENCTSLYNLSKVGNIPDHVYQRNVESQDWEMARYASALKDPRNMITHVEVDTNDNQSAAYFRLLMGMNSVPGQVRVVP